MQDEQSGFVIVSAFSLIVIGLSDNQYRLAFFGGWERRKQDVDWLFNSGLGVSTEDPFELSSTENLFAAINQ